MGLKHSLIQLTLLYVITQQVHSEVDIDHDVSKRQVSVLARDGHLPYQGKRYIGSKIENEYDQLDKPIYDDKESNEASDLFGTNDKRYVGALAKSGDLRFLKEREDKRDELDTLIEELLTAEELKKIRLEALREELYKEREENTDDIDTEKRSLSSLARGGNFPFREDQKRIVDDSRAYLASDFFKRGISSLARNGQLPMFSYGGKRGGISSVMRNRYSYNKRGIDELNEEELEDKRNVASLARNFNLPSGKRNIASVADFRKNMYGKKSLFEDWFHIDDDYNVKEKRYLGAFLASNQLPYSRNPTDYETKRNIGALARNWNLPSYRYAKRGDSENEENENILKNLINRNVEHVDDKPTFGNKQDHEENKLSFGSAEDQKSFAMRKKKSVNLEEQSLEEKKQQQTTQVDENKTHNDVDRIHRSKREALDDSVVTSDEYTMPVMQNADVSEYDDVMSKSKEDQSSRVKRFFGALARNGWLPKGHYYKGAVSKRHIGALARLGWLPSFRSARAYTRFGRDVRSPCKRGDISSGGEGGREDPGWASPWDRDSSELGQKLRASQTLDSVKRYLLLPALDNILLRRLYPNWVH